MFDAWVSLQSICTFTWLIKEHTIFDIHEEVIRLWITLMANQRTGIELSPDNHLSKGNAQLCVETCDSSSTNGGALITRWSSGYILISKICYAWLSARVNIHNSKNFHNHLYWLYAYIRHLNMWKKNNNKELLSNTLGHSLGYRVRFE